MACRNRSFALITVGVFWVFGAVRLTHGPAASEHLLGGAQSCRAMRAAEEAGHGAYRSGKAVLKGRARGLALVAQAVVAESRDCWWTKGGVTVVVAHSRDEMDKRDVIGGEDC